MINTQGNSPSSIWVELKTVVRPRSSLSPLAGGLQVPPGDFAPSAISRTTSLRVAICDVHACLALRNRTGSTSLASNLSGPTLMSRSLGTLSSSSSLDLQVLSVFLPAVVLEREFQSNNLLLSSLVLLLDPSPLSLAPQ